MTDDQVTEEVVEVECASCGRTTSFSPNEPEERRICPFCNGQVPEEGLPELEEVEDADS